MGLLIKKSCYLLWHGEYLEKNFPRFGYLPLLAVLANKTKYISKLAYAKDGLIRTKLRG